MTSTRLRYPGMTTSQIYIYTSEKGKEFMEKTFFIMGESFLEDAEIAYAELNEIAIYGV
jgi:hypothetical protein